MAKKSEQPPQSRGRPSYHENDNIWSEFQYIEQSEGVRRHAEHRKNLLVQEHWDSLIGETPSEWVL